MRRPTLRTSLLACLLFGVLTVTGCKRNATPAGPMKKKTGERVASLVFVGKKDACDCTKERVKKGWEKLQSVLKKYTHVKVERLQTDVHRKRVRTLKDQRRFLTLPAVYFFNGKGDIVGMLHGELNPDELVTMLE
ncbi:MAG: hypothetical protein ABI333_06610 [bacterium]